MSSDRPIRVLHVDDEPEFSALVAAYLERENDRFDVETEASGEDGIARLRENHIDCIVSDYDMPGMDGLEFLRATREFSDRPFVLFTGKGSEEIASAAISAGVTDYLQKGNGTNQYEVLANRIENSVSRYRAQKELEESQEFIERILDVSPMAVLVLEEDGTVVRANSRVEKLLEVPEPDIVGRGYDDLGWTFLDEAGVPIGDVTHPFRRVFETGAPVYGVQQGIERPDGTAVWLSVNAAPLNDAAGAVDKVITVLADVTERQRRERDLRETLDQFEGFSRVLSHDLGNMVSIAEGRIELARETGEREHLEDAGKSVSRMDDMIDALAETMRSGSFVSDVSEVLLEDVVRRAWETQEMKAATLEVRDGLALRADEDALMRLAENLLRNALEHGPETVTVRIGAIPGGFYFEDTGPGIPPGEREKILEPGYTTKDDGTGFGLVSIQQIALAHGWELAVREGSDGGARFEFGNVETRPTDPPEEFPSATETSQTD